MTKIIALTQGKEAIVDDGDFEWLSKWKWCINTHGYAIRNLPSILRSNKQVYMHREIMKTPNGMDTDHINGNKLDNRRSNIRICKRSQNKANVGKQSNNTSGYKGVSWITRDNKWQAKIKINGKAKNLGYYDVPEDAAKAYDEAAKKYFKEYAKTNEEL